MIDNVIAFLIGVVITITFGVAFDRDMSSRSQMAHECHAPCAVILPRDTLEDEFDIDYGWRDHHTSIVDVYYDGNGDAR